MDYSIKIDEFEGPLDLLLHLIKEDNIDIYNISIDKITKDYLDYINKMEELNINVASSYLVISHLLPYNVHTVSRPHEITSGFHPVFPLYA